MQTIVLTSEQIEQAVILLRQGEIVALPTETVYGLAADALNTSAIEKIFVAKGRPLSHPLILHVDSLEMLQSWVKETPQMAIELAEHYWPGPLTMIFKKRESICDLITGGQNTIAIRIPKHPVILEVIRKLGNGVVAPSANVHKKTSPTLLAHVLKTLDGKIAAVVDGGACAVGIESTIIDMTKSVPVILRPGAISPESMKKSLGLEVDCPINHEENISGNMKIHYQPEKPLFLLSRDEIVNFSMGELNVAVIHYSKIEKNPRAVYYKMPENKVEYAKRLYAVLHDMDNTYADLIIVETPPKQGGWLHVHDRLIRAANKEFKIRELIHFK